MLRSHDISQRNWISDNLKLSQSSSFTSDDLECEISRLDDALHFGAWSWNGMTPDLQAHLALGATEKVDAIVSGNPLNFAKQTA
ncbi:MAG: hypothetical protein WBO17_03165 [Sphingorhabdus sp.]